MSPALQKFEEGLRDLAEKAEKLTPKKGQPMNKNLAIDAFNELVNKARTLVDAAEVEEGIIANLRAEKKADEEIIAQQQKKIEGLEERLRMQEAITTLTQRMDSMHTDIRSTSRRRPQDEAIETTPLTTREGGTKRRPGHRRVLQEEMSPLVIAQENIGEVSGFSPDVAANAGDDEASSSDNEMLDQARTADQAETRPTRLRLTQPAEPAALVEVDETHQELFNKLEFPPEWDRFLDNWFRTDFNKQAKNKTVAQMEALFDDNAIGIKTEFPPDPRKCLFSAMNRLKSTILDGGVLRSDCIVCSSMARGRKQICVHLKFADSVQDPCGVRDPMGTSIPPGGIPPEELDPQRILDENGKRWVVGHRP